MDVGQAVDPDGIVQCRQRGDDVLAFPFRRQRRRFVHHVAQPQHQRRAPAAQHLQRAANFAAQAQRLLVDDEQVRVEDFRRVLDDRRPHRERLFGVDMQVQRDVVAIPKLDDPGDAHEVDTGTKIEAADDRRPRKDQHGRIAPGLDQVMRDRSASAEMAEPKRVVAVDQYASMIA